MSVELDRLNAEALSLRLALSVGMSAILQSSPKVEQAVLVGLDATKQGIAASGVDDEITSYLQHRVRKIVQSWLQNTPSAESLPQTN